MVRLSEQLLPGLGSSACPLYIHTILTFVLTKLAGGYLNESGFINMARLQVVLDEMKQWETDIFEKEYADINWFKGKQTKAAAQLEDAKKRSGLGQIFLHPGTFVLWLISSLL